MGGTGSVLQHERNTYSRAEETRLLKLYNRQKREDKLSGTLHAAGIENLEMGMGHSRNLGPPYLGSVTGLDGKDQPLLRQTQTGAYRDRDQWSRRVAGLLKASETCLGCPRGTKAAAAAIAETKKRQRRERLRARQSVMIQMYNNNRHADLDSSLASLRRSFHRCSTQGGGWATAPAVLAALKEVGVTVSDPVVLTLASQDGYAERLPPQPTKNPPQTNTTPTEEDNCADGPFQSAKNILPNNLTTPAEEDRLVYWPSILAFLEEAPLGDRPPDNAPDDGAVFAFGRKGGLDSTLRAGGESSLEQDTRGKSGMTHQLDGDYGYPGTGTAAAPTNPNSSVSGLSPLDDGGNKDSEENFEPDFSGVSDFVHGDTHVEQTTGGGSGQSSEVIKGGGRCCLESRPRDVIGDRRAVELHGKMIVPPRGVNGDTMGRARDVPSKEAREMRGHRREGNDTFSPAGGAEVDQRQLGCARGTLVDNGVGGATSDAFRDHIDVESLVNAACTAGKKGGASAINDLADRVDLRINDAFGRNALYYACLCGHASVAHLVAVRAYGGVEGIPENERWECRKNALSEEIRNYFDTGIFPGPVSSRRESCQRRTVQQAPAQAAGGRECGTTSNPKGSRGFIEGQEDFNFRDGVDGEGAASSVRHSPPADEVFSIASLFDSARDREERGDY